MILGRLPTTLDVAGTSYDIATDYRVVLDIVCAFTDKELRDDEKAFICLNLLYTDFKAIPQRDYEEAYKAALNFIQCGKPPGKKKSPATVDWRKDEQMIFAAVNKVAGREVRTADYIHWWTFIGYFDGIDHDDLYSYVLQIRQKLAKGKQLEKHEKAFLEANREIVMLNSTGKSRHEEALDYLDKMFEAVGKK